MNLNIYNIADGTPSANAAERLARNIFLALEALVNADTPNIRHAALALAVEKLHSNGMYLSEEGVEAIRRNYEVGGLFANVTEVL